MGEFKSAFDKIKLIPRSGLSSFVDFTKRAATEAHDLIHNLVTKRKRSKEEVESAAKYSIAKQFVEMYEKKYTKTFITEFIKFYSNDKVLELVLDQVSLETQKILISEGDRDIMKRKDRADGVMIIPKLAEKLEIYRMTVAQYERKHSETKKMMKEGEETFGKQDVPDD